MIRLLPGLNLPGPELQLHPRESRVPNKLHLYLCKRSRSDVNRRYSDTFRPVMSTSTSPVTTFIMGGCPPTPLGQEKPAPCIEQVQRTASWTEGGCGGGDVTGSEVRQEAGREQNTPDWLLPPQTTAGSPAHTCGTRR